MLRRVHLRQMRDTWPFIIVLFAGILMFLADYYEFQNAFARELVLALISLGKSIWFVGFVIRRIRASAENEVLFHEFLAFIAIGVVLFVFSYAIDFYCLYQIRKDSFTGLPQPPDLVDDFLTFCYFSVTNFTTAGLGDVMPKTKSARFFVASELIISFFFAIFIMANLATLRESYRRTHKRD